MNKKQIILGCALCVSTSAFASVTDEISKTFNVGDKAEFRLDNVNGEVNISAWDKSQIQVTAVITAKSQKARDRVTIEMKESSRGVRVETQYENSNSWNNNNSAEVEYTVKVPVNTRLADIEVVNGSLLVSGVEGEVNLDVVNGSIEATGLVGDSEINSVNGSIEVTYSRIDRKLRDISIDTVNGRIELNVPEDINADVEVETMHGSIKNDFGLKADKNMFVGRSLQGSIGTGDIRISIESVNGSVSIRKN